MVVELVAGRLISRYVGQSLYTWTGIISVVLAGISIGNYIGGRVSERHHGRGTLAVQFLLAAAGCLSMFPLNRIAGEWSLLQNLSWPARILTHITITFLPPALLLGTISPVIAKRALIIGRAVGRTMGGVYAWATAGSIWGTLLTGYYFLMYLRVTTIVLAAAAGLVCVGILYAFGALCARRIGPEAGSIPAVSLEAQAPWRLREWLPLIATVFIANACVMALEIVAGRMVGVQFGQSLYGWTGVIAVVLAGITVGSSVGGWLADAFHARRTLVVLFVISAIACLVTTKISEDLAGSMLLLSYSWPIQIALYCMAVFFLPSLTLGATTPVIAKVALGLGRSAGPTVGNIYAWTAIGSIAGTLVTGFYLIARFGIVHTLCLIAATLTVVACAYGYRSKLVWIWASVVFVLLLGVFTPLRVTRPIAVALKLYTETPADVVYSDESLYSYISVSVDPNDRNLRELILNHLVHSKVDLRDPLRLRYEYEWIYDGVLDKCFPENRPITAMVIGGGGYTFPRYIEVVRPRSYVEVSEIDPAVTEAAHAAFGLPRDTTIHIYNMDARNRIADLVRAKRRGEPVPVFDCVLGDSINDYSVPYHLTTLEFIQNIDELLAPNGLYMLNMIDLFEFGRFLGAAAHTCRQVFPYVYAFSTSRDTHKRDTYVLVCVRRSLDLEELTQVLYTRYGYEGSMIPAKDLDVVIARAGNTVLTDDFAPVENMLAPVVRMDADRGLLRAAVKLLDENKLDQAITKSRECLDSGREYAEAYQIIGVAMIQKGRLDEGIANLRKASTLEPGNPSFHCHLGDALAKKAKSGAPTLDEAIAEWRRTIAIEPGFVEAYRSLGVALLQQGDFANAADMLKKEIKLDPEKPAAHARLGMVLYKQGNLRGAITELNRALEINPSFRGAYKMLAVLHYRLREYDKAWNAVAKAHRAGESIDPRFEQELRRDSGRSP